MSHTLNYAAPIESLELEFAPLRMVQYAGFRAPGIRGGARRFPGGRRRDREVRRSPAAAAKPLLSP